MITEQIKAVAKAKLRQNYHAEDIAEELGLPLKLIEEWASGLDPHDLQIQQNSIETVKRITSPANKNKYETNDEAIKDLIEETTLHILKTMPSIAATGDAISAAAVEKLSKSIVELYKTFVLKDGMLPSQGSLPSSDVIDVFSELIKD